MKVDETIKKTELATSVLIKYVNENDLLLADMDLWTKDNLVSLLIEASASEEIAKTIAGAASLGLMVVYTNILMHIKERQKRDSERN